MKNIDIEIIKEIASVKYLEGKVGGGSCWGIF
jgi:hypothetical protein